MFEKETEQLIDNYFKGQVQTSLLIKLTNTCVFKCKYCFWFRNEGDQSKKLPDVLPLEVEDAIVEKIQKHILLHKLDFFTITFHGGEPLLFGKERFVDFVKKLRKINPRMKFLIQSNGYLIDEDWVSIFKEYGIGLGISIDGPKIIHDLNRRTKEGKPSFDKVSSNISLLRQHNVDFGILAVCNPLSDPREIVDFFVEDLKCDSFDILFPDYTHDDAHAKVSIADFYQTLFDYWIEKYHDKVKIRTLNNFIDALLGLPGRIESLGYGASSVTTIETNGDIYPTDILRITKDKNLDSKLNIMKDDLSALSRNPVFRRIVFQSLKLAPKCLECPYVFACGGGCLPHRWNSETQDYQHPSVYCSDIENLLGRIRGYLESDLVENKREEAR